jgi:hypothetical protein
MSDRCLMCLITALAACGSSSNVAVDGTVAKDAPAGDAPGHEPDAPRTDAGTSPGCTADSECTNGICNESSGSCVPDANVLFVTTTGDDSSSCTRAAPCRTIATAANRVNAMHSVIALAAGTYGPFTMSTSGTISGPTRNPADVSIRSGDGASTIATLYGTITIEGVSIGGNTMPSGAHAVLADAGASVTFDNVVVHNNTQQGIVVKNNSTLTLHRCELFASSYGVAEDATSTIAVDACYFHDNTQAGIALAGSYQVTNTIVTKNKTGVALSGAASGTLDYITLASQTTAAITSTNTAAVTNSIFAQNAADLPASVSARYTLFTGTAAAGTGNLTGNPAFLDAANGNYHIGPTSAAIDKADAASTMATDFDGDHRPSGAGRDVGADER